MSLLKQKIKDRTVTLGVVGLGYVGLPLAVEKAKAMYERLEEKTIEAAKATDKTIRAHPYEAIGIAFGVGFGDLSTFNAHFRSAMGAAPGVWRRARGQI